MRPIIASLLILALASLVQTCYPTSDLLGPILYPQVTR